jgi:predicted secreted hydrolase
MVKDVAPSLSRWGVRDVYMAHFALSDVKNRRFFHSQLMSREGPGLAAAAFDNLEVSVRDWAARMEDGVIRISARDRDYALSLRLIPEKPLVLHGTAGFSRKSPAKDQASYYYSFTRLRADGALTFKGRNHAVSGLAWMDHEFSSSMVLPDQSGWDWFCVQLDDGSELMISRMRKKTGAFERPFGTLVERDGTAVDLESQEVDIAVARTWTSPHSKAIYPSGWTLSIPGRNITLHVEPVFEDQELAGPRSLGVVYWEGAVTVSGSKDGRAVKGKGYVELTGYAGPLGGLL